jgi:hypothetical protein
LVLPTQLSLVASKRAPVGCSSGVVGRPLNEAPNTVPSNGPAANSWLVMVSEPAPGWFCTMICGFPGICFDMWRASSRALMS